MKLKNYIFVVFLFTLAPHAYSGSMGTITADKSKIVAILSAGPAWPFDLKGQQSLFFTPELSRTYTITNFTDVLAEGELFLGAQNAISANVDGQLGLVLAAASNVTLSGGIWDFDDPRFDNYNQSFTMSPSRIAIGGKLLRKKHPRYQPWVNGSIGLGLNKAYHHRVFSKECEAVVLPQGNFSNHTKKSFSYSVGAGIQRVLTTHWQVGLGYEFTDWGQSQLIRSTENLPYQQDLVIKRLYTNALLFNLTWLY